MLLAAERRWAWGLALVVMTVASLPYLFLLAITPRGEVFWGFINNPDDHCVYLAWMRQAENGQFFLQNLFTGDPQPGRSVNLFFWALGLLAGLTHLSLALVYHLARFGCGALLLVLVYHLAAFLTGDLLSRRAIFGFAALSSGLGWLAWPGTNDSPPGIPVDTWQPEAITFLSLYANALFCAAMAAMVALFLCLLLAQRTAKRRYVVGAGVLGFLLGNFHSYDVITIAAVWAGYLLVSGLITRQVPFAEMRQAVIAAAIAFPSVMYQYVLLRTDPVFQARAAVPTPSPDPRYYLLGYGLLVPLAALGAWRLIGRDRWRRPEAHFPVVWAIMGLFVVYLPLSFQRKLAEGLHLPIALLAAIGAVELAHWVGRRSPRPAMVVVVLLLLTAPSNVRFLYGDLRRAIVENVGSTGLHPVFWDRMELQAMSRLDAWVPRSALIQALPWTSCLIPAMSARRVWAGHWGETPDFAAKFGEALRFFRADTPSDWRREFITRTGITHIFAGPTERKLAGDSLSHEPFLRPVGQWGVTILYEVVPQGH